MTNEEKITRLRWVQRRISVRTRDEVRDFEALEAAIKDIETLSNIESKLGNMFEEEDDKLIAVNMFKELEAGISADNRLMAVSGMSVEELTDAFTKGYRLVSPDKANDQVPNMRVTKVTIDEARIVFQLDKETEGKQSEEQNGIFIPENATNGDVIKGVFPNVEIKHGFYGIEGISLVCLNLNTSIKTSEAFFVEEWWNAPYKESEQKNTEDDLK